MSFYYTVFTRVLHYTASSSIFSLPDTNKLVDELKKYSVDVQHSQVTHHLHQKQKYHQKPSPFLTPNISYLPRAISLIALILFSVITALQLVQNYLSMFLEGAFLQMDLSF